MTGGPEDHIQAHFVRAGRHGDKRRDWALFFFFRILSEQEMQESIGRMLGEMSDAKTPTLDHVNFEFANPTLWALPFMPADNAHEVGFVKQGEPSSLFLGWLRSVTNDWPLAAEGSAQFEPFRKLLAQASIKFTPRGDGSLRLPANIEESLIDALAQLVGEGEESRLRTSANIYSDLAKDTSTDHGLKVVKGRLFSVCAYEVIRHLLRAKEDLAVLRSAAKDADLRSAAEAQSKAQDQAQDADVPGDRSPIEIAFTHSGLRALALDSDVLSSFPDVFKDGMAMRAARLGDVGESAPSRWTGELGQAAVHGLLTGGFRVEDATEPEWAALRRQVAKFNEGAPGEGEALRRALGIIFRMIGLEIVHIEFGQDPYCVVDRGGAILRPSHRHEHFGFRDGISQPVRDVRLGDPNPPEDSLPGGGTPYGDESWAPVAPGEIFLGMPDEDGAIQQLPAHELLAHGGTYLVFRKLLQDVGGLRIFLARMSPGSGEEQERLAAQIVGRWKNGVSLVRAPFEFHDFDEEYEIDLNNFRYAAEDPAGRRCPLGAHVRRANPRDIGGRNQVKRHRIQRRGMAYGGAFLPKGSLGDGKERGLLFIALNSRIDLQFELIQSRWINSGEFLGQAGLGKCPLIGAHEGRPQDQFLEAGANVPLHSLPAFVRTRGGDYFFAPGIEGLKEIARGEKFKPIQGGDPTKKGLVAPSDDIFSPAKLRVLAKRALEEGSVIVEMPVLDAGAGYSENPTTSNAIVFIGRHADVSEALSGRNPNISVPHYVDASRRITMGAAPILIATDNSNLPLRQRMHRILDHAWQTLNPTAAIGDTLDHGINQAIRRTKQIGVIDLVHDLAVRPLYDLVAGVYGVPGPNWLTEAAVSLPFGRQHITELHPDWLAILARKTPANPRLATLQVWSILCFSDLIGNVRMQEELKALSMQAGGELTIYLEQLLGKARMRPPGSFPVKTLVDAFIAIENSVLTSEGITPAEYYLIVRLLLTELIASALAVIPATFGSLMTALLDNRVNLGPLVDFLVKADPQVGVKRLIYETNRLSPSIPFLQRYALTDIVLPSGARIDAGRWIGALVMAASFDPSVFTSPERFSLHPLLPGPPRDLDKYLMFGERGSGRACWGQNKLAMMALEKFVGAAAKLPGLRRVAGPGGAPIQFIRSTIGLPARFARH